MSKLLNITLLSGYVLLNVILFILFLVAMLRMQNSSYKYVDDLGVNWNKGPILSINPTIGRCQMGEQPLIDDKSPGTIPGCDCSHQLLTLQPISQGTCSRSKNSSQRFCYDIPPTPQYDMNMWGGSNICGRRVPASYLDLTFAVNESSCPTGMRSCGIADTKYNVLCFPNATACPLNKIVFLEKNQAPPTDFLYTIVELANGKRIAYTNQNTKGEIIHEFILSENIPCLDTSYYNLNKTPYILSPEYGREKCPNGEFDDRNSKVDVDSIINVYTMNGLDKIYSMLPLYQKPSDFETISLYEREYFGLSVTCKKEINDKIGNTNFLKNTSSFEEISGETLTWIKVAFALSLVAMILAIIFFVVIMVGEEEKTLNPVFFMIWVISGLILLILCSIAGSKADSLPRDYEILGQDGCTDSVGNKILVTLASDIGSAISACIGGAVLSGIIFLYPISFFFFSVEK